MKITKLVFDDRIEYINEKGQFHREDGPAVEYVDGDIQWWQNDEIHRLDGPAVENPKLNYFCWYKNNKRHRLDGPAVIDGGDKSWFFNGRLNRFKSEKELKRDIENLDIENDQNIKRFIINNISNINEGEVFLLRLVIANHFPKYLGFIDKFLILQ